jgi:peptidoglycan hydrolase CwlO-like protein
MNQESGIRWERRVITVMLFVLVVLMWPAAAQEKNAELVKTQQEIGDKEKEIAELNKEIEQLRGGRDATAAEAEVILHQLNRLKQQLQRAELELKHTSLTIDQVQQEYNDNQERIRTLQSEIEAKREQLRLLLRALYANEQTSLIRLFFDTFSLSEVLTQRATIETLQERTLQLVHQMRQQEDELHQRESDLEQQTNDLAQLEELLVAQQSEIASRQGEQQQFLGAKRSEQAAYENRIAEAVEARQEIEQQIFTLKRSGVEVALTNALDMARYAGRLAGMDPALLLAVLKVESNVGGNIGSGTFPDDMQPASRDAFIRITNKLGLDPRNTPIARRPANGQGWGGAMGPAQIMPATWEGIEVRLEQLMGKSPVNPYELTDAFVATAVLLADRGAADPSRAREAIGRYIAGPNWQYYTWYVDKVMAVAKEYEREL